MADKSTLNWNVSQSLINADIEFIFFNKLQIYCRIQKIFHFMTLLSASMTHSFLDQYKEQTYIIFPHGITASECCGVPVDTPLICSPHVTIQATWVLSPRRWGGSGTVRTAAWERAVCRTPHNTLSSLKRAI